MLWQKRRCDGNILPFAVASRIPPPPPLMLPLPGVDGTILAREVDFSCGDRAITHYKVEKALNDHALVSLQLETARTHQIRVHMKYIGYPPDRRLSLQSRYALYERQALHSYRMSFIHPITKEPMTFTAALPQDMEDALICLCPDRL